MDSVLRSQPQRQRPRLDLVRPPEDLKPPRHARVKRWRRWVRVGLLTVLLAVGLGGIGAWRHFAHRYDMLSTMAVPLEEVTTAEYPEDPAARSVRYGQYNGRRLTLVQKDERHFDFILEPTQDHVAQIVFRDVDVSLMTPSVPAWCHADAGLTRIALTDREWNRQQVKFDVTGDHIEISGGDGFEQQHLAQAALAKNCLNAGLWEVILSIDEGNGSAMYYQGWFTFPLGHYRRIFEQNTGLDYGDHWFGLEHWSDPAGTVMEMNQLRTVCTERDVAARFDPEAMIRYAGEQVRKQRTTNGQNLVTWGDILQQRTIQFATFIPPGRYSVDHPWENEYWRLAKFEKATLRECTTPTDNRVHELELTFRDTDDNVQRFIVGGIDLAALPQLATDEYPQGLYMPMGIGVPPFYQSYAALQANPPDQSPYYSFLLDAENRWIDHHAAAVDGPVLHRDQHDPNLLHLHLLSYERHSLVAHFQIPLEETTVVSESSGQIR